MMEHLNERFKKLQYVYILCLDRMLLLLTQFVDRTHMSDARVDPLQTSSKGNSATESKYKLQNQALRYQLEIQVNLYTSGVSEALFDTMEQTDGQERTSGRPN